MKNRGVKYKKKYWQTFDQTANIPEFSKKEISENISRRNFLELVAVSLSMAGITSCRRPIEKIIPYVIQQEEIIPGVPQHYATTMPFGNSAYGLIVESHEGRPTKIEGNPEHPSSMGASNVFMQSTLLDLYDPDRSKIILYNQKEENLI